MVLTPVFSFEPAIYRTVIDDVILAIKPEFDEFGVPEDVLAELQHVSMRLFSQLWSIIHLVRNGKIRLLPRE